MLVDHLVVMKVVRMGMLAAMKVVLMVKTKAVLMVS